MRIPDREDAPFWRVLRRVGTWSATAVGVLLLIFAIGSQTGWLASVGTVLVVAAIAVAALLPVLIGAGYLIVRRAGRADPARAKRLRPLQTGLAALVDRVGDPTPDGRIRRTVLVDRTRITSETLAEIDDREEALGFLWGARPAQAADFPGSPDFLRLPMWAQDAVVLLDLRRELQLRGPAAFDDAPGFYRHPFARVREAVARLGSTALDAALMRGRRMRDADAARDVLEILDRRDTWARLLDPNADPERL